MTSSPEETGRVPLSPPSQPRFRGRISAQTMTSLVASLSFVTLAAILALVPVPYVTWGPGTTVDVASKAKDGTPLIQVEGLPTHGLNGQLRMTTVSVTKVESKVSIFEALGAYWLPSHDSIPREKVYPKTKSVEEVKAEEIAMMDTSQRDAIVAALRAAGQPVNELPMIERVSLSGPSKDKLQPGDLILEVDSTAVQSIEDVQRRVKAHKVGDKIVFTVERAGKQSSVTVTTVASPQDPKVPLVGVAMALGYRYKANVAYGINPNIVGPSAGTIFALAIYDLITEPDLLAGRKIAGTGTIQPDGNVGSIGGIQEKIKGAEKAGAKIFLVPAGNCQDLAGVKTSMELVKISTLRDAISSLQKLNESKDGTGVPRC